MDVPPHPHCALSTVTYLFDGAVEHRDSTGGHAVVRPGEIHWMRSGHGIVHSERSPATHRIGGLSAHGLQLWCAHPDGEEEQAPRFDSWRSLPTLDVEGIAVELLAGEGWGSASPVAVTSPLLLAHAHLPAGARLALPDVPEVAVAVLEGQVGVAGTRVAANEIWSCRGSTIEASVPSHVLVLGGDPIGERFMWWNLIHSDLGRLREQADRYRRGEFPEIPEDPGFMPAPLSGP